MKQLHKIQESKEPNVGTYMQQKKIDFLISIPREGQNPKSKAAYMMRRAAVDCNIPLLTNTKVVKVMVRALKKYPTQDQLGVRHWREYR